MRLQNGKDKMGIPLPPGWNEEAAKTGAKTVLAAAKTVLAAAKTVLAAAKIVLAAAKTVFTKAQSCFFTKSVRFGRTELSI